VTGAALARRPRLVGRQAARLGTELARITAGASALAAAPRDRRFADPAWTDNPWLRRSVQAYLAAAGSAEALLDGAELDWRDDTRLKFGLSNLIAAAAPSNNPLLSPVGWKSVIDTGGRSAVRGLRALVSDLSAPPRVPSMVAADAFEVGRDLAVTPGGVVHSCEQFELIQYQPATESVYRYPLLIVPPMINKFYITDLSPGRSMAEFLVGGPVTFVLSTSGHIASMVNPPANPKASFQTAAANPPDPGDFLTAAHTVAGSWWSDYSSWLAARSGERKKSPRQLGRKGYPVQCAAPGTYVHDR
jgi:polyhydroxyalkanoate synthase